MSYKSEPVVNAAADGNRSEGVGRGWGGAGSTEPPLICPLQGAASTPSHSLASMRQSGLEPASAGYRPAALPLSYGRDERELLAGIEPARPAWEAGGLPLTHRSRRCSRQESNLPCPACRAGARPMSHRSEFAADLGVRRCAGDGRPAIYGRPAGFATAARRPPRIREGPRHEREVVPGGVEPPSPVCETGVLPLN